MAEQDKEYSVVRAFTSFHKDGSGTQQYFTAGNQHMIKDWLSPTEIAYRVKQGDLTESEVVKATPPVTSFVAPAEAPAATPTPAAGTRGLRAVPTNPEG